MGKLKGGFGKRESEAFGVLGACLSCYCISEEGVS